MKKYLSLASIALLFVFFTATPAWGQLLTNPNDLEKMTSEAAVTGNLSDVSVGQIVARGVQVVLSLLAVIFLALTITAGFKWMTAAGNDEQVKQATKTLKAAIIGLLIVLAAYTITYFIFTRLPFNMGVGGGFGTSG